MIGIILLIVKGVFYQFLFVYLFDSESYKIVKKIYFISLNPLILLLNL